MITTAKSMGSSSPRRNFLITTGPAASSSDWYTATEVETDMLDNARRNHTRDRSRGGDIHGTAFMVLSVSSLLAVVLAVLAIMMVI